MKFNFDVLDFKQAAWIVNQIKKLPKETLKSLEDLGSTKDIGIDSPSGILNSIRIYPINKETIEFKGPKKAEETTYDTRFTHKGIEYSVHRKAPSWLR